MASPRIYARFDERLVFIWIIENGRQGSGAKASSKDSKYML